MRNQRRQYTGQFKFRVALEALQETKTISEIASQYEIHPTQVKQWKRQLREGGAGVFENGHSQANGQTEKLETELYEQIGCLKMELEWLKKKAAGFS
jgi:transposase-like protein